MTKGRVSYIITDHNITVNYDGQTHIVPRTDSLAPRLIDAIKNKKLDEIPRLVEVSKRVEVFGQGNFTVENERILIGGREAPATLSRKILRFMNDGLPAEPLIKFAENLLKNPSYRAVNELFQFLEKNDHPITDNGCFIAYKKVRADFKDQHTGTIDNSPGKTVEIPRNQVNEDPTQTCSYGLHVANWNYANNIYTAGPGAKMLEVEVNPADVVAVPIDYDQAKMRVCRYVVLDVVDKEHSSDTPLRVTINVVHDEGPEPEDECEEVECEDVECCVDCGVELDGRDMELCYDCDMAREEEEENFCTDCGTPLEFAADDLCLECEEEREAEEEEERVRREYEEKEVEEEDRYPWEDELDEE